MYTGSSWEAHPWALELGSESESEVRQGQVSDLELGTKKEAEMQQASDEGSEQLPDVAPESGLGTEPEVKMQRKCNVLRCCDGLMAGTGVGELVGAGVGELVGAGAAKLVDAGVSSQ